MLRLTRFAPRLARPFVRPFSVGISKMPLKTSQLPARLPAVTTFRRSFHSDLKEDPEILLSPFAPHTKKLQSSAPRIGRFLDCMQYTIMREEIEEVPWEDFTEKAPEKVGFDKGLKDMKSLYSQMADRFGAFSQHIGVDSYRFGPTKMQMQNASMLSDAQIEKLLDNLHSYVTCVKTQIEEIIITARALINSWIRFSATYPEMIPMPESIQKDEGLFKALDFSGKPRFATVLKSIDKDLQDIRALMDKSKNERLTYEENWKVFYLADKWAEYIEKCGEVKVEN